MRPGQGDGGIDVFVPNTDVPNARVVFQVKRYASNLTSSQIVDCHGQGELVG